MRPVLAIKITSVAQTYAVNNIHDAETVCNTSRQKNSQDKVQSQRNLPSNQTTKENMAPLILLRNQDLLQAQSLSL